MFNKIKNLFQKQPPSDKRYFFITSHGQTATLWLAAALSKHPNIFCSHGYSYPPEAAEERELTARDHEQRVKATNERFWTMRLNEYLLELCAATTKPIIGNVHAFTYGRLNTLLHHVKTSILKNILIFNMVRHPIPRLQSTYFCWTADRDDVIMPAFIDYDFNHRAKHIVEYLNQHHQIEYTPKNKAFIVALLSIEDITRDIQLAQQNKVPHLVFEHITTNPSKLSELLNAIRSLAVSSDFDLINDIFALKKMNQHNRQSSNKIDTIYANWDIWKQDAFNFLFETLNMNHIYADFQYDFSFL